MPSQHRLPEQERDPSPAPRSTVGTRKPLAPKCQIVVSFHIKNRIIKKRFVTCHSNKTGIHYTQETHAHGQTSRFTSSGVGKAEPSALPHPPVGKSLHPNPAAPSILPVPETLWLEGGAQAGGQKPRGCILREPWTPPDPTYRPRCPQGTKGSRDRALELPPTYYDLGQAPPGPSALTSKGHTTRNEGAAKKGGRRLPRELGHGPTQASKRGCFPQWSLLEPGPRSPPLMPVGPR